MTEKFLATSANLAAVYHVDEDCKHVVHSSSDPRPVTQNAIAFHDITACPACAMDTTDAEPEATA